MRKTDTLSPICATCTFWNPSPESLQTYKNEYTTPGKLHGTCHRYPPTVTENATKFPIVSGWLSCGERKPTKYPIFDL